ncbi:hypothetical protein [Paenibacillus dendritiformis]|uniref:hypothetical protein n=1 Tax=Paenibacillus dendritiformis TaxID=130049 RepID=UPI0011B74187|nr:hypothetical protein [Paenibacillus dendritiformis]
MPGQWDVACAPKRPNLLNSVRSLGTAAKQRLKMKNAANLQFLLDHAGTLGGILQKCSNFSPIN